MAMVVQHLGSGYGPTGRPLSTAPWQAELTGWTMSFLDGLGSWVNHLFFAWPRYTFSLRTSDGQDYQDLVVTPSSWVAVDLLFQLQTPQFP